MKADATHTYSGDLVSDTNAKRFRNQGTGIGQCLEASEETGAVRSQRVINAAPPAQRKVADRSYPAPGKNVGQSGDKLERTICGPWRPGTITGGSAY